MRNKPKMEVVQNRQFISTYSILWNSLPNSAVDANSVNALKARLDKFWLHQEVMFNFTADLSGTGNRSVLS